MILLLSNEYEEREREIHVMCLSSRDTLMVQRIWPLTVLQGYGWRRPTPDVSWRVRVSIDSRRTSSSP